MFSSPILYPYGEELFDLAAFIDVQRGAGTSSDANQNF